MTQMERGYVRVRNTDPIYCSSNNYYFYRPYTLVRVKPKEQCISTYKGHYGEIGTVYTVIIEPDNVFYCLYWGNEIGDFDDDLATEYSYEELEPVMLKYNG